MSAKRSFPPCAIRLWFHQLKDNAELSVDKLARLLILQFPKPMALEIVQQAISDGVLEYCSYNMGMPNKKKGLRLRNISTNADEHDLYCYECHLPGQLVNCSNCVRTFHRTCYRKKPRRPNYSMPSTRKNILPTLYSDTDTDSSTRQTRTAPVADDDMRECSSMDITAEPGNLILHTNNNDESPTLPDQQHSIDFGGENKPKLSDLLQDYTEVIYVCERPPPRRRRLISYKSEQRNFDVDNADVVDETQLCTACRLLRTSSLHNPPGLGVEELNYLIDRVFETHRSWMKTDVTTYIRDSGWSEADMRLIKSLLFPRKEIGLNDIAEKIRLMQYNFFIDFLIDLLDFQHNIGVFFGDNTSEAEQTKYLLRDVSYELDEIRRCPDCFRYSNEMSKFWFCKPCVQRHELVYAKARGFPYWPAKVIRVLHRYGKYDVRFFGEEHSRALIPANCIKPIDTDVSNLKQRKSIKLKEALQELEFFQALSAYPPSYFGFYSDKAIAEGLTQSVLRSYMPASRINEEESTPLLRMDTPSNLSAPATLSPKNMQTGGAKRTRRCQTLSQVENSYQVTPKPKAKRATNAQALNMCSAQPTTRNTQTTRSSDAASGSKRTRRYQTLSQVENSYLVTPKPKAKRATNAQTLNMCSAQPTSRNTRKTRSSDAASSCTCQHYKTLLHAMESVQRELTTKKCQIEKQALTIAELKSLNEEKTQQIKRQQWCFWCLEKAKFMCCFKASYCSRNCQQQHWRDGHQADCTKKS